MHLEKDVVEPSHEVLCATVADPLRRGILQQEIMVRIEAIIVLAKLH